MELIATRNKGAEDILPSQTYIWQTVEDIARSTAATYAFEELRFPTFEKTELFERSVGETTDVVQKEMWTVMGRKSTYTLRPEGTAGAIRAVIQNGLLNDAMPRKLYYLISCFRHENVQKGRLWEFHQFGAEMIGSASPAADAEVIDFAHTLLDRLGLGDTRLCINSIGCPECRRKYYEVLKEYLTPCRDKLCETCQSRFDKNPMRIIDCKIPADKELVKDAPVITDYLCDECREHFETVKSLLDNMGLEYTVDPKIVRGLDYYTRTVFEFVSDSIGAQGTICGGGRYDRLIDELCGTSVPALGFAMGLERVILAMKEAGFDFGEKPCTDIYIGSMGDAGQQLAMKLAKAVREDGYRAECDMCARSVKAQLKYADKTGAKYCLIIGDNEVESKTGTLKNLRTGSQTQIALDDTFADSFLSVEMADSIAFEEEL